MQIIALLYIMLSYTLISDSEGKEKREGNGKKYKKRSYRREDWERTEGEGKRENLCHGKGEIKRKEATRNLCRSSNK